MQNRKRTVLSSPACISFVKIIEDATSGEADATSILENAEQSIYNIRQGRESNGPAKVSEVIVNDVYTKLAQITGDDKENIREFRQDSVCLIKCLRVLTRAILFL